MDVLNPELVWIGQRCYRVNIPNKEAKKLVSWRNFNYENEENCEEFEKCTVQPEVEENEENLEEISDGRFQLKMHCPQMFHSHVIGVKGKKKKTQFRINKCQMPNVKGYFFFLSSGQFRQYSKKD